MLSSSSLTNRDGVKSDAVVVNTAEFASCSTFILLLILLPVIVSSKKLHSVASSG
jgi:hypothetical protein